MKIVGKTCTIRPLELSDAPRLAELKRENPEVFEFANHIFPKNVSDEESWIKTSISNTTMFWGIESDGKLIGITGLSGIFWVYRSAEFLIAIYDKNYQRKGIGLEVTYNILRYAFEYLNLHRVYAKVNENNVPMIKILEKLQFIQEAKLRQFYRLSGKYYDAFQYSIILNEYWRLKQNIHDILFDKI